MGRHSSSDSEYRESKRKKKKRSRKHSRSRSRSPSYSHRSNKSSTSRKRRSRSRSHSSERGRESSPRRKRSKSYDRHRRSSRRSRSRSSSRDRHSSSRKRSRSKSRDRSSKTKKSTSRDQSRSPTRRKKHKDAVLGVTTGTLKDVMDIVPGFSKMTGVEQSKIRIQRALKAAVESTTKDEEAEAREKEKQQKEDEAAATREKIDRLKAIEAIADSDDEGGDDGFMPTHFKSSVKLKKKLALAESKSSESGKPSFMERESTHELAIFGHTSMLSLDEAIQSRKQADQKVKKRMEFSHRDPETLVADQFLATHDELQQRWKDKLQRLRNKYFKNRPIAV